MTDSESECLARSAYEMFVSKSPWPGAKPWNDLPKQIQDAWRAVVCMVAGETPKYATPFESH